MKLHPNENHQSLFYNFKIMKICFIFISVVLFITGVQAQEWVTRYNGSKNDADWANDIAIDSLGNVYVTGYSTSSASDYATVKYNNSGVEQWVARYHGLGSDFDWANAIVLDASGNVYVTGQSSTPTSPGGYGTVKYNNAGVKQWSASYVGSGNDFDAAYDIALDSAGNVYVTGRSYGGTFPITNCDCATIKYTNSGSQEWVARYNGPGDDIDSAFAIAIDISNNIYITGYSTGLGTNYDCVTIKYNNSGAEQWVARYNGPANDSDGAYAIAIDNLSNVYITGSSQGSGTYDDYVTIKYNSSGNEQWVSRYNGSANNNDVAYSVVVDPGVNCYVTGYSKGIGTGLDCVTIKYNSAGEEQWVARYNGVANNTDEAKAIAIDNSGNVYITGKSIGVGTNYDYITVKYNNNGVEQWAIRYNNPPSNEDYGNAIAVDSLCNVYVTGGSGGIYSGDYATIKYPFVLPIMDWINY